MTASLLKSPGHFSVFWPILIMLYSGWSLVVLLFPSLLVPFTNSLVTASSAQIKIGITVTFMFHRFFSSLISSRYLSLFPISFNFTLWSAGTAITIIIIYPFRVFHISVSWWFFTGVWVTASLLISPGLSSVFWLFSIMLSFGWSPLGR